VNEIHSIGVKFVPIIDSGIASRPSEDYDPYSSGIESGIFIKNPVDTTQPLVGNSWPVETVYVDWSNVNSAKYWNQQLANFRDKVNFDGLWLEMNEIESDCNGPCSLA
jgi:alpha-glucosidase